MPASWTVSTLIPGDCLLVGLAAELLAVIAGFVEPYWAAITAALDDGIAILDSALEWLAVISGTVCASGVEKLLIHPTHLAHPTPIHTPQGLENHHQASGASSCFVISSGEP